MHDTAPGKAYGAVSHERYLQPQPLASACGLALAGPQHDALADGSQQLACSVAEQQVDSGALCSPPAAVTPVVDVWV